MGRKRAYVPKRSKLSAIRRQGRYAVLARSMLENPIDLDENAGEENVATNVSDSSPQHVRRNDSECLMEENTQDTSSLSPAIFHSSEAGPSSNFKTFESEDDNLPPLEVATSTEQTETPVKGYRVVDVDHLAKQYCEMAQHARKCTFAKFSLVKEVRNGLSSVLIHICEFCNYEFRVETERDLKANDAAVWGSLSIGIGHTQLEELLAVLDVPSLSAGNFRVHQRKIGENWQVHLTEKMRLNGEEEKQLAIAAGDFYKGMVFITVIVDGGWARRSYGHGFNSASGVVVIIGARTKKILYLCVKNKYCFTCSRAKVLGVQPSEHACFVNYKGSSTGMEQSGIVDGFKASLDQHGLMYRYLVGDGDSSVFARVREQVPYGRYVEKLECANHVVRCYKANLHKILTQTRVYALEERNLLKPLVDRLAKGARAAIRNSGGNLAQLKADLANGPKHVLGHHENCREVCTRRNEQNLYALFGSCKVWEEVQRLADSIVKKADRLLNNVTTNQAERYMGLVAQLTGGKRRNLTSSGGYTYACVGAGLSHITGPKWHLSPWKRYKQKSPGTVFKRVFERRNATLTKRRLAFSVGKAQKKTFRENDGPDMDYGPNAAEIDLDDDQLKVKMDEILNSLQEEVKTLEESAALERATVGQRDNPQWREARKNRLTASKFGLICNRRPYTPCHNQVKELLYGKPLKSKAVQYGVVNESKAVAAYEKLTGNPVQECGLFVPQRLPHLGASPDGLVGDNGLLEVKCLPSIGQQTAKEAAMSNTKTNLCVTFVKGTLVLKPKHQYWFQIQGQLNITGREWCDLVLFSDGGVDVIRIHRNQDFWESEMLPKINRFYMDCVLPEIADGRLPRGMAIRDPPYILEAISENKLRLAKKSQKRKHTSVTETEIDSDEDTPQPLVM